MVLPLGGPDVIVPDVDAPDVVKTYHAPFWWLLVVILLATTIAEIVAADLFDSLFTLMLTWITWFMVRGNCSNMTQQCLLMYGLICFLQAIFETITLCGSLGGRQEQTTNIQTNGTTTEYTTTIVTHPFLDQTQGWLYFFQSVMMIVNPSVMMVAMFLSIISYSAFPTSLFAPNEDTAPVYRERYNGYGGPGYSGPNYSTPTTNQSPAVGHRLGGNGPPRVFEGQGQRLGS